MPQRLCQPHAVLGELLHSQPVHQDSTALDGLNLVGGSGEGGKGGEGEQGERAERGKSKGKEEEEGEGEKEREVVPLEARRACCAKEL